MKSIKKSAAVASIVVALATITGCAASPTSESTGKYVDDAAITAKVKAAMLDQPTLKTFQIHVETFKGSVRLRGVAASRSTIDKAVEVARGVNGVKSVKNGMRVL